MFSSINPTPRVSQLDSFILDNELFELLNNQIQSIFANFKPNVKSVYNKEIQLLLKLLLFKFTIWEYGSTYGMKLQNLLISSEEGPRSQRGIGRNKKLLLLALLVSDYLYDRFQSYLYTLDDQENDGNYNREKSEKSFEIMKRVSDVLKKNKNQLIKLSKAATLLNFINYLLFLVKGNYPSLSFRLLRLKISPIFQDLMKFSGQNISFEFQNRQLVWNVLTEFLIFTLPLLKVKKLKSFLSGFVSKYSLRKKEEEEKAEGPLKHLSEYKCAICFQSSQLINVSKPNLVSVNGDLITNPYITSCGHLYCYICLVSKLVNLEEDNEQWKCLRCNQSVAWFERFNDVDKDAIVVGITEKSDIAEDSEEDYQDNDDEYSENDEKTFNNFEYIDDYN